MRFIIIHRTSPTWEAGAKPDQALIERVGHMLRDAIGAGVFLGGEGLRSSALGVRIEGSARGSATTKGPFAASSGLANGFVIFRAASLEDATAWARKMAQALGDAEVDVRPVSEPWDIGVAPEPPGLDSRRFMALHKHPGSAHGKNLAPAQAAALASVVEELRAKGILVTSESMRPSDTGARITRTEGKVAITDGPFPEAKELIGGYMIVNVGARADGIEWARRYASVVESEIIEVRELLDETANP